MGLSNDWNVADMGDDENKDETAHHACARIIHGNGDAKYKLPFAQLNAEPALVTDGSGYSARLKVLPTFGCVLHEEKP
jgi:hypothetical protein